MLLGQIFLDAVLINNWVVIEGTASDVAVLAPPEVLLLLHLLLVQASEQRDHTYLIEPLDRVIHRQVDLVNEQRVIRLEESMRLCIMHGLLPAVDLREVR